MSEGKNILHCPTCGFAFDVSYGRAFACGGCPFSGSVWNGKMPKGRSRVPLPSQHGNAHGKNQQEFEADTESFKN